MQRSIKRAAAAAVTAMVIAGCGGASDGDDEAAVPTQGGDTASLTAPENTGVPVTPDTGDESGPEPGDESATSESTIGSTLEVHDVDAAAVVAPSVAVRARAALAGNVGAKMVVRINGVTVGSTEVRATQYTDHSFPLKSAVAPGSRIDVAFTNNATVDGRDRNLYIEQVRITGVSMLPTDAGATVDLGSGAAAFDGVDVIDGRGDLRWNGALRLKVPGETLVVRARGTTSGGVGPTMQVRVDGAAVGSVEVKSSAYADYRFAVKSTPSQRVDVVFTNNGGSGTEDRNLYVESARFGSRTLRPADSGALVDLGSGAAAFDGVNLLDGQGALLWDAALRLPVSAAAVAAGNAQLGGTSTNTATVTAPPPGAVDIRTTGARCDGSFDNSEAIAAAILAARRKGVSVFVPGGVCAYGDVIRLLSGVKLIGSGEKSVLYALNPLRSSIYMYGSGSHVSHLKLAGRKGTTRLPNFEGTRITLFGATNFVIDNVTIDGSTGAAIQTSINGDRVGSSHGRITNNVIRNTLADAIHLTSKASYITVEHNRIENSGDDGIAVVSYRQDGGLTHHITARHNVVVNNKWGRNMSVVGGANVLYENNRMETNLAGAACLYIAQETAYKTYGAHDVVARYNTLKNCGSDASRKGHGAVMVFSNGEENNTNITLTRNDIVSQGPPGIRVLSSYNRNVRVDSNRVTGGNPALQILSTGVTVIPYTSGSAGYLTP